MCTFVVVAAAAASARAEPPGSLGRLERESVDEALARLGLAIDPSPEGKVIGRVHVVNQDVFSRHDWYFHLLNAVHRTTRPEILGRELLVVPGQRWDDLLADESVRNLQSMPPLFFANGERFGAQQMSSIVALVPVASPVPGTVDVLAVTRDVWSLRFNTNFEFQKDRLTLLETSLSENNLFGWRKQLAARFEMDLGRFGVGPTYFDPNMAGTRLTLLAAGTAWYARGGHGYEGDNELFSLRYPLYSLASRWGAGVDVIHRNEVIRRFCDNELCPADVAGTAVPFAYRRRDLTADAGAVRSFGQAVVQRVTLGYRFDRRRSLVPPDFPIDPANPDLANEFLATWAPLPETRSEPYLRYQLFTARYGVFRDLDTFDLRENRRLGPLLAVEIAAGLPALGADFVAYPIGATAGWAVAPGGSAFGLAQVMASARARWAISSTSAWGRCCISRRRRSRTWRAWWRRPPPTRSAPTPTGRASSWAATRGCAAIRSASSRARSPPPPTRRSAPPRSPRIRSASARSSSTTSGTPPGRTTRWSRTTTSASACAG